MNFRQKLIYSIESIISFIFLWLSLPFVFGNALIVFIIRGRDEAVKFIEYWEDNFLVWRELLSLYRKTGCRYSKYEVLYFIFEDKRNNDIRKKDKLITPAIPLFENDTIIYFEGSDHPKVKRVIRRNRSQIKAYSSTKDLKFFFWPAVGDFSKKSVINRFKYKFPFLNKNESSNQFDFFNSPSWVAELLNDWLEEVLPEGPCLIHNTNKRDEISGKPVYEVFLLPAKGNRAIKNAIFSFICKAPDRNPGVLYQLRDMSKNDD